MGWTRGKDAESPGKFAYELWEGFSVVERLGGFDTWQECDRAAEQAQRRLIFGAPGLSDAAESLLSDADLIAELLGDDWQAEFAREGVAP